MVSVAEFPICVVCCRRLVYSDTVSDVSSAIDLCAFALLRSLRIVVALAVTGGCRWVGKSDIGC